MDYLYLLIGLTILILSGNYLIKGGVQIANYFKIPKLIVGLTIVSIGTSAPELFVSIGAAISGSPDLSIGNVVGSNIANIGLILGITALISPIPIAKESSKINYPIMLGISILLWIFTIDSLISFWDGFLFVLLLICYISFLIYRARTKKKEEEIEEPNIPMWQAVSYIILASLGLYYGAELLISASKNIAISFGISERIIGLTILALGTSIPELITSAIAIIKKQADISVGNILGSNIFNITSVLGITGIIHPININNAIISFDIPFMIFISTGLFLTMLPLSRGYIGRIKGVILLLFYLLYIAILFL